MTLAAYNRQQIEYRLDISAGENITLYTDKRTMHLLKSVSAIVGGCTIIPMQGAWCDVERANLEDYAGIRVGIENGIQLQVKCELHKEDKLEEAIKNGIQAMRDAGLDINWVCGIKETVNAFNFNMAENK